MATAKDRWEQLHSRRDQVLYRARQAAELTIPSIMPPEGSDENTNLPTPYQSLGARGVNNLASKLLLTLLPPNTPFFRFTIADKILDELGTTRTAVDESLRQLENRMNRRVERSNLRVIIHGVLKHLIIVGSALLYVPKKEPARMHSLSNFVVVRDPSGRVTEGVVMESVHPQTIDPEIRAACDVELEDPSKATKADKPVNIYTHIRLADNGKKIEWNQEINEKLVPGSEGRSAAKDSPWLFLRWSAAPNEDYGRGMVEEYMGDLRSLDGLSKAILQFSAAAAKIVFLVAPNSVTDDDAVVAAQSGDFVTGRAEDIGTIGLEKFNDFQVAKATIDDLSLRLSHAFLLQSGTVRNAERVTAAEIQAMAQELEDVLGGVYTVQSQELQLPLVRRLIAQMKSEGEFPKFPAVNGEDPIEPTIITGFEALGRGHELNRFRAYFSDLMALNPNAAALFGEIDLAKWLATKHNVDVADLLKTEDDLAQERQASAMQQAGLDSAPGVAKEVAKGAVASGQTTPPA